MRNISVLPIISCLEKGLADYTRILAYDLKVNENCLTIELTVLPAGAVLTRAFSYDEVQALFAPGSTRFKFNLAEMIHYLLH